MRMLRGIVDVGVEKRSRTALEPVLQNMAAAVGQLLAGDAARPARARRTDDEGAAGLMQAVVSRMTDRHDCAHSSRVTSSLESTPTDRLAQAFQTLVREPDQQQRLLALARDDVAASPLGSTEGFEDGLEPRRARSC